MNLNPNPSGFGTDEKSALNPPPAYAGPSNTFQTTFASLSLHMSDRIRLLQFPPSEIAAIREVIRRVWTEGIQAERPYSLSYEFKLRGYPWGGQGSYAIPARTLMREIFAYLFSVGWILTSTTDVSKKKFDKDTLIFRHQPMPPPPSNWCAVSFNQSDRLRLIGAPPELTTVFRTLLKGMGKLQDEFWKDQSKNGYEFKIYGSPWWASGEETMVTRLLLLKFAELLESQGWSLYASVDQNNGTKDTSETDSWYCVKAKDWVPGNTVFHR